MKNSKRQFRKEKTYDVGYGYLTAYYYTGKENFVITKDTNTSWGVICDGCDILDFKRLKDAQQFILGCVKMNYNPVNDYAISK